MSTDMEGDSRLTLRRTKSVTRAEEIQKEEARVRRSQPDKPCHKPRDSLFSWSSGFDNFTGLVNWGFLLLFMGGFRLFLENFIKYGIRIDPVQWFTVLTGQSEGTGDHPSLLLLLYSAVPIALCLLIEKGLSVEILSNGFGMIAHCTNIVVMVLIPIVVIYERSESFSLFGATSVCMIYSILFLKLWSYVHVNLWCRTQRSHPTSRAHLRRQSLSLGNNMKNSGDHISNGSADSKDHAKAETYVVEYPDNLYLKDIYYFMVAPTLCYELNFPRTTRIRKRFLIKRIFEVIIGFQLMMCLIQQWIIPSVKNSLIPFSNMDVAKATERLLKLAIPNHLVWLIFFYLMFHSLLNMIGELLHFADRNFYCDWWNANNIDVFWRSWNMPVHRWAVRHLYIPLIEMGCGRNVASIVVFFISAFFHEYLVSVPLKTFKTWIFLGMMGQIPLSFLSKWTEKHFGPRWGNMIVWASLIIGQPLCIMMYYHDYIITHHGSELLDQYSHID